MSSYLYGMHDQIVKGYAPLRVTKGGPHFVDSQGLNPEGLGGEGSPSMSEDVNPASRPSYVMDTATVEGQGSYGGKLKQPRADVLGEPQKVAETATQAFSAGVRNRFHKLEAKPRLMRHPLNANVRQLDTLAERYIAAPQYEDPTTRTTNAELQNRIMSRSDTVIETPEISANEPIHIGLLLDKAKAQNQMDAVRAANMVSLRALNVSKQAARLAAGTEDRRLEYPETKNSYYRNAPSDISGVADRKLAAKTPEDLAGNKSVLVGLGLVALVGALVWVTVKVV